MQAPTAAKCRAGCVLLASRSWLAGVVDGNCNVDGNAVDLADQADGLAYLVESLRPRRPGRG